MSNRDDPWTRQEAMRGFPDPRDPRADSLLVVPGSLTASPGMKRPGWSLVGLPYDGGAPRPGARFGPAAFRRALRSFTPYDGERSLPPVADLGDLDLPSSNGRAAHARIEEAAERLAKEGRRCLLIGGDHGCTGSVIRGLANGRGDVRLALISIDAHLDVREYDEARGLSSGTPIRRALETSIADPSRTAIVGLRPFANAEVYFDWVREQGIRTVSIDEITDHGPEKVIERVLEDTAGNADAIYLTIDLDAVDAAQAPGVSAPGTGGLTTREILSLVRVVTRDPRLIAADIVELSPPHDLDDRTARLAARLSLELLRVDGMDRT